MTERIKDLIKRSDPSLFYININGYHLIQFRTKDGLATVCSIWFTEDTYGYATAFGEGNVDVFSSCNPVSEFDEKITPDFIRGMRDRGKEKVSKEETLEIVWIPAPP